MSSKSLLLVKPSEEVKDPVLLDEYKVTRVLLSHPNFLSDLTGLPNDSFDEITVYQLIPDDSYAAELFRVLKPGAKLLVDGIEDRESGQNLSLDLKIQGFVDIMAAKEPGTTHRFLVAQKPKGWAVGSSAQVTITKTAPQTTGNKWKLDSDTLAEEELIDENALLMESELEVPVIRGDVGGCGDGTASGKRRACANCSCGLADEEKNSSAPSKPTTDEEKLVKASSCGNCYKGDAFRCASCPFLGLPAFEPGTEKVVLSMGHDDI